MRRVGRRRSVARASAGAWAGPAAVAKRAFAVFEPGDRARVVRPFSECRLAKVDAERERMGGGFREGDVGSWTMSTSSAVSAGGVVQRGG